MRSTPRLDVLLHPYRTRLVIAPRVHVVLSSLAEDVARAAAHAAHARAPNTRRWYAREWVRWEAYALEHGASALPASPLVVVAYMAHLDAERLAQSSLDVGVSMANFCLWLSYA